MLGSNPSVCKRPEKSRGPELLVPVFFYSFLVLKRKNPGGLGAGPHSKKNFYINKQCQINVEI